MDEDLLVQVKACAICGSDVHGMDGSTGRRIPRSSGPRSGRVVAAVGASVQDLPWATALLSIPPSTAAGAISAAKA